MKLADFGWSNFNKGARKTYCGTLDYLAPEMILEKGHDEKLDVWCLGVLLYELITGKAPFTPEQQGNSFVNINLIRWRFIKSFREQYIKGKFRLSKRFSAFSEKFSIESFKKRFFIKTLCFLNKTSRLVWIISS